MAAGHTEQKIPKDRKLNSLYSYDDSLEQGLPGFHFFCPAGQTLSTHLTTGVLLVLDDSLSG